MHFCNGEKVAEGRMRGSGKLGLVAARFLRPVGHLLPTMRMASWGEGKH